MPRRLKRSDISRWFAALAIILPSIALAIFSRYDITQSVHEQNLLDLGYEEETEATYCALHLQTVKAKSNPKTSFNFFALRNF